MISDEQLTLFQICECLVTQYKYQIINLPNQKDDLWLTSRDVTKKYPLIRINTAISNSPVFESEYMDNMLQVTKMINPSAQQVLIINTNNQSEEFDQNNYKQVICSNNHRNQSLLDNFPLLNSFIKKSENNDQAYAQIKQRMENLQKQAIKEMRKKRPKPKMTIGLICLIILSYIVTLLISKFIPNIDFNEALILSGANYKALIYSANEWWRLFTSGFVHTGFFHVLLVILTLYPIGDLFEQLYSKKDFVLITLSSLLIGNLAAYVIEPNTITLGITPAMFGMFGALIIAGKDNRMIKTLSFKMTLIQLCIFSVITMTLPHVSIFGTIVGLIIGMFVAILLVKGKYFRDLKKHVIVCLVLAILFIAYGVLNVSIIEPTHKDVDSTIVRVVKDNFKLEGYGNYLEKNLNKLYGD